MKNELRGLGKVFAFTFERQVKSRGYLAGTILFALLCFKQNKQKQILYSAVLF